MKVVVTTEIDGMNPPLDIFYFMVIRSIIDVSSLVENRIDMITSQLAMQ
jgi:hypothetical protein